MEEAAYVKGYDVAGNRWVIEPVWPPESFRAAGKPSRAGRGS